MIDRELECLARSQRMHVHAHERSIADGRVMASGATAEGALLSAVSAAPVDAMEIVTIYYGSGASEDEAHGIATRIRGQHTGVAVEVVEGGQPHYPYVVSLE